MTHHLAVVLVTSISAGLMYLLIGVAFSWAVVRHVEHLDNFFFVLFAFLWLPVCIVHVFRRIWEEMFSSLRWLQLR
jgi:hypothetical protein